MKRLTTMCVAAVFGCVAAVTAQTQQTGETQQTQTQRPAPATSDQTGQRQAPTPSQAQGRAASSMFIGCVEKGSTPNAFVLNVTEIPGATATAGTTAARQGQAQARAGQDTQVTGTTGAMVGHKMELIGGTNMAAHVGHKVEITGMVAPQGTAAGRPGQTAATDMRVNVSNLRMIDTNCTPAAGTRSTTGTSGTTTSEPAPAPGNRNAPPDRQDDAPGRQY